MRVMNFYLLVLFALLDLGDGQANSSSRARSAVFTRRRQVRMPRCTNGVDEILVSMTFPTRSLCIQTLCRRQRLRPLVQFQTGGVRPPSTKAESSTRSPASEIVFMSPEDFRVVFGKNAKIIFDENRNPAIIEAPLEKSDETDSSEESIPEPGHSQSLASNDSLDTQSSNNSNKSQNSDGENLSPLRPSSLPVSSSTNIRSTPELSRPAVFRAQTFSSRRRRPFTYGPDYCDSQFRQELQPGQEPSGSRSSDYPFDVDVCCKTEESYFINNTLLDVFGTERTIAQFDATGSLQFIRHGTCGPPGLCWGTCEQQYITVPLVIHPPHPGETVSFSFFKIPGYCSCRIQAL